MFKLQVAFKGEVNFENAVGVEIIKSEQKGSVYSLIVKGDMESINEFFESLDPMIYDIFSLSAEEIMVLKVEEGAYE